jgi:hypothetical protein
VTSEELKKQKLTTVEISIDHLQESLLEKHCTEKSSQEVPELDHKQNLFIEVELSNLGDLDQSCRTG